jgi:hypothetical protein
VDDETHFFSRKSLEEVSYGVIENVAASQQIATRIVLPGFTSI